MKDQIVNKLAEIEVQEEIRILYACESGSRAWGFPSKDSDYGRSGCLEQPLYKTGLPPGIFK